MVKQDLERLKISQADFFRLFFKLTLLSLYDNEIHHKKYLTTYQFLLSLLSVITCNYFNRKKGEYAVGGALEK